MGLAGCAGLVSATEGHAPTATLEISTSALPSALAQAAYSATLSASGGTAPYTWTVSAGQLPAGISLSKTAGTFAGTPTDADNFSFTVQVKDSSSPVQTASRALSISVSAPNATLQITTASLPAGQVASSYSVTLQTSGGKSPVKWSVVSGSLPTGLALASSGQIGGTPAQASTVTFTVQATDSSSPAQKVSKNLSLAVTASSVPLQINLLSLPNGMVSAPYSGTLAAAGGTKPYTWSISSGTLPEGLTLASTGQISGTPTKAGTSSFTAQLDDSNSPSQTAQQAYTVKIADASSALPLTSCGALTTADGFYMLQNDVSAPGTCFSIQADGIILDLNGHTITYNTADQQYARYAIVGINCWDPDLSNGRANGNPCAGSFANLTVFGGTITEGTGAAADYAHSIRLGQNMSFGPTIYDVTFNFHSNSAQGIFVSLASNASGLGPIIHDNVFNNAVTQILDRDEEDGLSVHILGCSSTPGLTSRLFDNTITGGPQSGLYDGCVDSEIDHNTVSQGNPNGAQSAGVCSTTVGCQYTDDFGILAWQDNGYIHDNTIEPREGRGIEFYGPSSIVVANNTIVHAQEMPNNSEYNGCTLSGAFGIHWKQGMSNAVAQNNNVSVTSVQCIASALRLTFADSTATTNNTSVGNSYTAVRTSATLPCPGPQWGAPNGCAFAASFDMGPQPGFVSTNDTFTGDSGIFWFDCLGANNVTFISPTFNKGATQPSTPWYFINAIDSCGPVVNFHIRDAQFGSGVDPTNNSIPAQGTSQQAVSVYIDWTYAMTVTDQLGNPVSGASVTAVDAVGSADCQTTTDANGIATCVLPEYRLNNDTKADEVEHRNPIALTISKSGCATQKMSETVTQKSSETVQLSCP
jgi:hypothetical protein